jgi:hypothetical protein
MRKVLVVVAGLAAAALAGCNSRVFHVHHTYCDLDYTYAVAETVTPLPCCR